MSDDRYDRNQAAAPRPEPAGKAPEAVPARVDGREQDAETLRRVMLEVLRRQGRRHG